MRALLAQHLKTLLAPYQKSLTPHPQPGAPWIVLMVGSNGGGKTTTVGKLAHLWSQNYRVRVAAADTFRAAASEQLAVWAKRSSVAITLGTPQEDPASVAVRALQEAVSSGEDILLVDTAGRLSNKEELLQELAKIHRVLQRQHIRYASEGYERLLVLDATTGQNVLAQAEAFQKTVPLTGCILNKLDGTAKGGTLFALTQALHLPIVGIGTGESADDFSWFQSDAFVDALLPME